MRLTSVSLFFILAITATLLPGYSSATEQGPDAVKTLVVVPVKSGKIDKNVYSQFDRLVPELKKISKSRILKLVCSYSGQPKREQDIDAAYNLAAHIQKYMLARHNLDLDLWIAVDITPKLPKKPPVLTLAVFPEGIKKLDAVLLKTLK